MRLWLALALAVLVAGPACGRGTPTPGVSKPELFQAGGPGQAGLGVRAVRVVTGELRRARGLPEFPGGVVVDHVYAGSPAAAAGIQPEDVVRTVDGVVLHGLTDLTLEPAKHAVGDQVEVEITRGAQTLTVTLRLFNAVAFLEAACQAGDLRACADLGRRCGFGWGVAKDETREAALYRQACDGGDPVGCRGLGSAAYFGSGLPKDLALAARLYQQACDGGDPAGCDSLGAQIQLADGVARDDRRAAALLQRACEGGAANGCVNLGVMYRDGLGVGANPARAAELFRDGCERGAPEGCYRLALLHETGSGVAKDEAEAARLHQRACDGEVTAGCEAIQRAAEAARQAPAPMPFDGLYRGEIAGKPVIVVVSGPLERGTAFSGTYAYVEVGKPITLAGTLRGSAATLEESTRDGRLTGRWKGEFAEGGYRGEWTSPDGKRRAPISLSREVTGNGKGYAIGANGRWLANLFLGELARRDLVEQPQRAATAGAVTYRFVVHKSTAVAYPRLVSHPDPQAMARINTDLEARHLESAGNALDCPLNKAPDDQRPCDYQESVTVDFFSPEFLSVSTAGAVTMVHVNDWQDTVTYDLKTGRPIDLLREFRVTKPEGTLSEAFRPLFLRKLRAQLTKDDIERGLGDCYADDEVTGYRVLLALGPSGLIVRTHFIVHIATACDAEVVIPYAEMARFRGKSSPYRFGPG